MPCAEGTEWDQEKQTCDHAGGDSAVEGTYMYVVVHLHLND